MMGIIQMRYPPFVDQVHLHVKNTSQFARFGTIRAMQKTWKLPME